MAQPTQSADPEPDRVPEQSFDILGTYDDGPWTASLAVDPPREYAAAGVPYFLRIDFRNRVPALALLELVDGEYQPVAAAAAGSTFVMKEPFEFAIDPAELLDEPPAGG